jgi:hypothetical protein
MNKQNRKKLGWYTVLHKKYMKESSLFTYQICWGKSWNRGQDVSYPSDSLNYSAKLVAIGK